MRYKNTDAVPINEERDLVEVVRCKDCKLRDTDGCYMSFFDDTGDVFTLAEDNDFCSYGERREK